MPPPQPFNTSWTDHGPAPTNAPAWLEGTSHNDGGSGSYQLPDPGFDASSLPPVRVPNKGKGKDLDNSWSDDLDRDAKRLRRDGKSEVDVENDIAQVGYNPANTNRQESMLIFDHHAAANQLDRTPRIHPALWYVPRFLLLVITK